MTITHTLKRFPLLASVASDRSMHIWEVSPRGSINTITTFRGGDELFTCDWSPSGRCLALAGREGTVEIIDAETATSQLSYRGHTRSVCTLAWSPDGTRIASGGRDKTVHVWDPTSEVLLCTYDGHRHLVTTLAFSPDGNFLASGSWDGTAQIWSVTDGKLLATPHAQPKDQIFSVAWSPNGSTLAVAGTDVRLYHWDQATASSHLAWKSDEHRGVVYAVAWSPDGHRLASGSFDGTVHVWEADQGKRLGEHQHTRWVRAIAWDPSGQYLASGGRDMQIHVWRADTGHLLSTYREHRGIIYSVSWTLSPLACSPGKTQPFPFSSSPPRKPAVCSQTSGHSPAQQSNSPSYVPPRYISPSSLVSSPHVSVSPPPTSPRRRQALPPRKPAASRRRVLLGPRPLASKRSVRSHPLPVRSSRLRRQTSPAQPPDRSSSASLPPHPVFPQAPGTNSLIALPSPYTLPASLFKPFHFPWPILLFLFLPLCLSPVILIVLAYVLAFLGLFLRVVFHL